jgi:hypothetical protein
VDFTVSPDDYAMPVEMYLNKAFGPGTWVHDPFDDKFIVYDYTHAGPGRGFIVVDRQLRRHSAVITSTRLN